MLGGVAAALRRGLHLSRRLTPPYHSYQQITGHFQLEQTLLLLLLKAGGTFSSLVLLQQFHSGLQFIP